MTYDRNDRSRPPSDANVNGAARGKGSLHASPQLRASLASHTRVAGLLRAAPLPWPVGPRGRLRTMGGDVVSRHGSPLSRLLTSWVDVDDVVDIVEQAAHIARRRPSQTR
jgi:hypothetical protein